MSNEKIVYTIDVKGNATAEIDKAKKAYDDFKKNVEAPVKEIPLARQLRDIKLEMVKMDQAGMGGSKAFLDLARKGGAIKDSIAAANGQLKTMAVGSNLEKNLNFARGAFDALNASAQITTGAMAIFGYENENVEKSIQKMMALMSMSNGVKTLFNALTKEGALVTGLMSAKTAAAAAIQGVYTVAIGTSTGALKAFKIALLATGIGALIVGLGLLIENWDKLTGSVDDNTAALKKNKEEEDKKEWESTQKHFDNISKKKDAEISFARKKMELQRALGASNTELAKSELELVKLSRLKLFTQLGFLNPNNSEEAKQIADIKEQLKISAIDIKIAEANVKNAKNEIKSGSKVSSSSVTSNSNKLVNAAPKTFNVYINELGAVDNVNIMGVKDEKEFQQQFVNTVLTALNTISVQAQ